MQGSGKLVDLDMSNSIAEVTTSESVSSSLSGWSWVMGASMDCKLLQLNKG